MGKYLGDGYLYLEAKEKFMKNITVEGAELAKEIGPFILKNYHFPRILLVHIFKKEPSKNVFK